MNSDQITDLVRKNIKTLTIETVLTSERSDSDKEFWFVTPDWIESSEGGVLYVVHEPSQRVFPVSSSIPPSMRVRKIQQILGATLDG